MNFNYFVMCHVHIREVLQVVSRTVKLFREAFNQCDSPSSLSDLDQVRKALNKVIDDRWRSGPMHLNVGGRGVRV